VSTKGLRTRQEIVEASLQIFSVKGYYNTSISDILQATGLTKRGLYGHFASKEEIWASGIVVMPTRRGNLRKTDEKTLE
jgi:AcrR family transcriptional regulator